MREFDTDRLFFRLPTLTDFDEFSAMRTDPVVMRYIDLPVPPDQSWQRLLQYRGAWELLGFGFWIVREKQRGAFVGCIGFGDSCRDITPPTHGLPEAGWVLSSAYHGMGYGSEGVEAACRWLDSETPYHSSRCIIDPRNEASLKLAVRNGFRFLSEADYRGELILMFERSRAE